MISWRRIEAVMQRHIVLQFRDLYRLIDIFFWPVLDIMLWGFTAVWLEPDNSNGLLTILLGLVLWQVVYRASLELAMNMMQELWDRNLAHLFSTPLTLLEWVIANLLLSIARVIIYVSIYCIIIWALYDLNIFVLLPQFIWPMILLLVTGWSIGFFCCALLIYSGQKAQAFVLPISFVLMPFSGVFYPLSILPWWMQKISLVFPTTYVFENMRAVLELQGNQSSLIVSLLLSVLYISSSFFLFVYLFKKGKQYGFARLE